MGGSGSPKSEFIQYDWHLCSLPYRETANSANRESADLEKEHLVLNQV